MGSEIVRVLPSGFIPYPDGVTVRISDVKFSHAEDIGKAKEMNDELGLIEIMRKCIVTEGTQYDELSVGDWFFLLLTIISMSFFDIKYKYGKKCPKCDGKIERVDLGVCDAFGKPVIVEKEGIAIAEVAPNEVNFISISKEDIPSTPVEVVLDSGEVVEVDFFRIKHYIEVLKGSDVGKAQLKLLLKGNSDNMSMRDLQVIKRVREIMDHGPDPIIVLKCPLCGEEIKVQADWRGLDFTAKSISESDTRARIRFGRRATPVDSAPAGSAISESGKSIPKIKEV